MDVRDFFSKLRTLALTLDKESRQLEEALNNKESEETTGTDVPMKILYDMQSEVRTLKGNVHTKLCEITSQRSEIHEFVKAAATLRKRTATDIERLKTHFQNYGYDPPAQKIADIKSLPEEEPKHEAKKASKTAEHESDTKSEQGENGVKVLLSTPSKRLVASWDPSCSPPTPQLADFGLSHYQFTNPWDRLPGLRAVSQPTLDGTGVNPPKPAHVKATAVTMPKTPKCTLRMEDEDFTPKLEDFGISENTMCLNADFTMELMKKNNELAKSLAEVSGEQTACMSEIINGCSAIPRTTTPQADKHDVSILNSPLPPSFRTPGLKIQKKEITISTAIPESSENSKSDDLKTPPFPVFETQGLNKDTKYAKPENKEISLAENSVSDRLSLEEPPPFVLKSERSSEGHMHLSMPPMMHNYDDLLPTPPRPEMTSQLSEDVLKVLSRYENTDCQELPVRPQEIKKVGVAYPMNWGRSEKSKSYLRCLATISDDEYLALPSYLRRQISLDLLRSSVQKINGLLKNRSIDILTQSGISLEEKELRNLLDAGPQTRMLLLSLIELNRLEEEMLLTQNMYRLLTI